MALVSIEAELDPDGNPTGKFLVIDSTGQVVHRADSFKDAVKWVDDEADELQPPVHPRPKG